MTRDEAAKWLSDLGLAISGTKDELFARISKFKRFPNLVKKLRSRTQRSRTFVTSLNPLHVPPVKANWKDGNYPKINEEIYSHYISLKKEGSTGQQEKAHRMIQSRKIVSVKTISEKENTVYVKAMVKKSYGHEARPAIIYFDQGLPKKGYCSCPIGPCGLCCHVIALLLFLKHFTLTGEKILALTCTQQLQRWHRRSKGSIPMIPLNQIKLKSATKNKKENSIEPADPTKSKSKRDVPSLMNKIKQNIRKMNTPVTEHFYNVLSQHKIGRTSSYGEHICFKFLKNSLGDHQYVSKADFQTHVLGVPEDKEKRILQKVNEKLCLTSNEYSTKENNDIVTNDNIVLLNENSSDKVVFTYDKQTLELCENIKKQISESKNPIQLDICFLEAPDPIGSNYVAVQQNTDDWHLARKFKITGSRLPSLLGFRLLMLKNYDKNSTIYRVSGIKVSSLNISLSRKVCVCYRKNVRKYSINFN